MNDKEKELWRVIDNVIKCCAITNTDGTLSITREEVLGKSRAENLVMTRCMVVEQMIHAGFSVTTIVSYNNGKFIIAETKQSIQSEVESTLHNANYIIEHIEDYKSQITQCEDVLKELNPQYAKDKARDEEIANIKSEVAGMKTNIDKILAAVTNK